jgi:hypothetical protein
MAARVLVAVPVSVVPIVPVPMPVPLAPVIPFVVAAMMLAVPVLPFVVAVMASPVVVTVAGIAAVMGRQQVFLVARWHRQPLPAGVLPANTAPLIGHGGGRQNQQRGDQASNQ